MNYLFPQTNWVKNLRKKIYLLAIFTRKDEILEEARDCVWKDCVFIDSACER